MRWNVPVIELLENRHRPFVPLMLVGGGVTVLRRPPFAKVTTMLASLYGPAGDVDATEAHLFECGCEQLFAVSHDQSGKNLPPNLCPEGWQLKLSFALGVREAMPVAIAPDYSALAITSGAKGVATRQARPSSSLPFPRFDMDVQLLANGPTGTTLSATRLGASE